MFVHSCATRNLEGYEPRAMIYFRVTSSARPEGAERVWSDALLDPWLEWSGLHPKLEAIGKREPAASSAAPSAKL